MKVIETALKEVGQVENPPQSNCIKYNTWFYNKEVKGAKYAWCGTFVSWCFAMSGLHLGVIDYLKGFAGCPYAVKNISKWGRLVTVPKEGDVVFFDWNGDGVFDHTGIFIKDLGQGAFESIEGNTSEQNQSDGGRVMVKKRYYKVAIFVRPKCLEK